MAKHTEHKQNNSAATCKICCKEIPLTTAITREGSDYVWNFCGMECYKKWKKEQTVTTNKGH